MRTILVTPADVSLFHVAAREMGSALDWLLIAQANGIVDPVIRATGTLRIPDAGTLPLELGDIAVAAAGAGA